MKAVKPGALLLFSLLWFTAINPAAFAAGTWSFTGSLHTARDGHTATLLSNGNVVVAGGESNNLAISSTEVYSPTTHAWSVTDNLNVARANAQALRLANGLVLTAGGCVSNCQGSVTSTAELYNSTTRVWSITGAMTRPRTFFGAVMISGGRVLVMGGCTVLNANGCGSATATAEIYNPATGKWTATGSMRVARNAFPATVLPNGKVLVAGGSSAAGDSLSSSELYNPATGTWTLTGRMNVARSDHTAILLATGNVLVAGGENISGTSTVKAELFNPLTGKWTLTGNLNVSRVEHTAALLSNGKVLVSGGMNVTLTTTTVLSSAELYDPVARTWSRTGFLHNARAGHTSTLLHSGVVLDAAGSGPTDELISAETYTP
jgi:N-acetylneuraminic acid mutarotase